MADRLVSPELLLATPRFTVVRHTLTLADGSLLKKETIQHPGAVVILPWFDNQQVGLIRNFRLAVGDTLWELPAGTLEPGETPLANAQRELREETGYTAEKWTPLGEMLMSPGILHERMHFFVAEQLQAGGTALEPGELIENVRLPWESALGMIDRGEILDAKTVAALLLWERRLTQRLKQAGEDRKA
ncbi:MAG: NUDIX hydrolase [Pirellulales bacterium]|nr:NUDIX hydrolase [Pirellulales bacterium]